MVRALVRVHLTESLNAIWNAILIRCMWEKKERILNEVDILKENQDLLKELWHDWEEVCKFVFKEMEDIAKETEISLVLNVKIKIYVSLLLPCIIIIIIIIYEVLPL